VFGQVDQVGHAGQVANYSNRRPWRLPRPVRDLIRHKSVLACTVVLLLFGFTSLLAPVLPIQDPSETSLRERLSPPSAEHWFGTDHQGRDILSRTVWGGRISLLISLSAVTVAAAVGVTLGLLSGFFRGLDNLIMRITDVQLSFPAIMLAIAIVAALGPSLKNLILVLAITGWVDFARVIRAEVLSLREREFSEAARALGCREARIAFRHVLPNTVTSILILATLQAARFMLQEAGLSFLGLGVPPDTASWGGMLNEAQQQIFIAWWPALFPGLAISAVILSINLFGDWLSDVLDSRSNA
jgi:peptide/nickel transport system permease protein